jgi:hypothetical protein
MNYHYILPTHYYIPAHRQADNFRTNYPEVDPTQVTESAGAFQGLMADAHIIIEKFATSKQFASQVMDYAQKGNQKEVQKLIQSTGIKNPVEITFNPDSINFTFIAKSKDVDCCKLVMALHW